MKDVIIFMTIILIISSQLFLYASVDTLKSKQEETEQLISNFEEKTTANVIAKIEALKVEGQLAEKQRKLKTLSKDYKLASDSTKELIYGDINARYTINMYGDTECPFCKKIHLELKSVVDHSQGAINWKYKHFPLSFHNPVAANNAQAIECIAETHGNQKAWIALGQFIDKTKGNGGGVGDVINFVRSFGLNGRLIEFCLRSDSHKGKINNDYSQGIALNINSTPALHIVDNKNNRSIIAKGYLTKEAIIGKLTSLINR